MVHTVSWLLLFLCYLCIVAVMQLITNTKLQWHHNNKHLFFAHKSVTQLASWLGAIYSRMALPRWTQLCFMISHPPAYSCRGAKVQRETNYKTFYSLRLELAYCHLCHIILPKTTFKASSDLRIGN